MLSRTLRPVVTHNGASHRSVGVGVAHAASPASCVPFSYQERTKLVRGAHLLLALVIAPPLRRDRPTEVELLDMTDWSSPQLQCGGPLGPSVMTNCDVAQLSRACGATSSRWAARILDRPHVGGVLRRLQLSRSCNGRRTTCGPFLMDSTHMWEQTRSSYQIHYSVPEGFRYK